MVEEEEDDAEDVGVSEEEGDERSSSNSDEVAELGVADREGEAVRCVSKAGTSVATLCRDEDFAATGSVDKSAIDIDVEDSLGGGAVVELVPSANKVVYASCVPLILMQSTLKELMLMLVQRLVGTSVASSLQDCVFGPEYVVTV